MSLLKDLLDRMLTPDLDAVGGRTIEEAILLEHARDLYEVNVLLTAEPLFEARPELLSNAASEHSSEVSPKVSSRPPPGQSTEAMIPNLDSS